MPVGGDIIQLTHEQAYGGQAVLNVYYFEAVDGTADLAALASWFNTNVVAKVKLVQTITITHTTLRLVNIFDDGETYDLALSGTGSNAGGDTLTSFTSAAIRLLHSQGGLRTGYKRIACGSEGDKSANIWNATFVGLLEDIADHLINPLSPTLATWAHVIVKRIAEADPITGEITYGLPSSQAFATVGYPTSYEVRELVTTQNSRKNTGF